MGILRAVWLFLRAMLVPKAYLALENLALRQQLAVCWDHVIVLNESHLHRILTDYFGYYHYSRPHLSLDRNSPTPREVEPPSQGEVISIPMVGGLHHRYSRAACQSP